jgi:hypothetical protein
MDPRAFIVGGVALLTEPLAAEAQQGAKVARKPAGKEERRA